ncbi:MAG: haloalkane dehalogenase [Myxococcota bacterium]|nr:haloalkane dehalogenase [Myxococcota bacterium]
MESLRTPDARFEGLPDWPFAPHYAEVEGLRIHYVDEGPRDAGETLLFLHGEPSWSYLYRFMIPPCAEAGHRVVAPDLVGFGRSDKPARRSDYTFARQVAWTRGLLEALDLRGITLFAQDWGSLIGLRLVGEHPERFARVVIGNGGLPTGEGGAPLPFRAWRAFAAWSPWFPISRIVDFGSARRLSDGERRAYDAPFPDSRHTAGARAMPGLVPISPDDPAHDANLRAWQTLERFERPFLTLFSTGDPITRGLDEVLQARIPGARGREHARVPGGHFLQEDSGPELAHRILRLVAETPDAGKEGAA